MFCVFISIASAIFHVSKNINLLSATPLYNMMFHVILLLVLVVFLFHNYFRYIMFTVVKLITHSENGSTRKHAIGKK